jgi:polar amino acid transport system substrate-binding protein
MRASSILFSLLLCFACPTIHAERPTVILASSDYAPYYGPNLPNNGGIVEIVVEAYRLVGYDVKIRFLPFPRALQETQNGKYDGIIALWHRNEREQWFAFSSPLASNVVGFYKRKNAVFRSLRREDLGRYRIGIVRGYAAPHGFDTATLSGMQAVTNDIQNLRKLALGRIDLAWIDKAQAAYLIETQAPELTGLLEWMEPPFEVIPLFLGLSKQRPGYQKRLDDFNRGLAELSKTGRLDRIRIDHGWK